MKGKSHQLSNPQTKSKRIQRWRNIHPRKHGAARAQDLGVPTSQKKEKEKEKNLLTLLPLHKKKQKDRAHKATARHKHTHFSQVSPPPPPPPPSTTKKLTQPQLIIPYPLNPTSFYLYKSPSPLSLQTFIPFLLSHFLSFFLVLKEILHSYNLRLFM